MPDPMYRPDLALVHDVGFGFHADRCAPGILSLLAEVQARDGLVLEIGCGTGHLTRHLLGAGHRVLATDASPAMLDRLRHNLPAVEARRLTLPDDEVPAADAVVSVGHALSYLPSEAALRQGLLAMGAAVNPGGVLAVDVCDLRYGRARDGAPPFALVSADMAIITRFTLAVPERFERDITTFVRTGDGSWQRDDEHHDNVLVDTSTLPSLLGAIGVEAQVRASFGDEALPEGLVAVVGRRAA